MIQTDTDISFPLLLNLKMTNVKPNWVSSLFCSHILFSKRISFHPQGELWAAACVCASNIVCRSTWWGSGEWRVKSSPSSAQQALGPASLGPWHTEFSPTSLLPWPFFFFFFWVLSSVCHAFWEKSASICSGCPEGISFWCPQRYSQGWQSTLNLVSFTKRTPINSFKLADKEGTPILKAFLTDPILLLKQQYGL